jgi:AbrB family looped-hinge helix DNA binding protein
MVEIIKMDKQGRITIPAQIRNLLSLSENNLLEIDIQTNQIVIRKQIIADPEKVEIWFKKLSQTALPALKIETGIQDSKWYSEDYVKQKLGL